MITHAESAEFLSDVQTMIDLDFNDQLDTSRLTRTSTIMSNDPWFTGPYAPSIPDEDIWTDFGWDA